MTTWDWRASKALGWWLLHDLRKSCSGAIDFFGVSFLFLANLQRHFQIDHSKSLQHNWVIGRSIASASLGFHVFASLGLRESSGGAVLSFLQFYCVFPIIRPPISADMGPSKYSTTTLVNIWRTCAHLQFHFTFMKQCGCY